MVNLPMHSFYMQSINMSYQPVHHQPILFSLWVIQYYPLQLPCFNSQSQSSFGRVMSSFLEIFCVISCIIHNILSEEIICNSTDNQCQNKILECKKRNENCSFICSAPNACINSTFLCPPSATLCTVQCLDQYSCYLTNTVCARNSDCNIESDGEYAMAKSKISGPYRHQTLIECNQDYSCRDIWIDTRHSIFSQLTCDITSNYSSCPDITIYCPTEQLSGIDSPICSIQRMFITCMHCFIRVIYLIFVSIGFIIHDL